MPHLRGFVEKVMGLLEPPTFWDQVPISQLPAVLATDSLKLRWWPHLLLQSAHIQWLVSGGVQSSGPFRTIPQCHVGTYPPMWVAEAPVGTAHGPTSLSAQACFHSSSHISFWTALPINVLHEDLRLRVYFPGNSTYNSLIPDTHGNELDQSGMQCFVTQGRESSLLSFKSKHVGEKRKILSVTRSTYTMPSL